VGTGTLTTTPPAGPILLLISLIRSDLENMIDVVVLLHFCLDLHLGSFVFNFRQYSVCA